MTGQDKELTRRTIDFVVALIAPEINGFEAIFVSGWLKMPQLEASQPKISLPLALPGSAVARRALRAWRNGINNRLLIRGHEWLNKDPSLHAGVRFYV